MQAVWMVPLVAGQRASDAGVIPVSERSGDSQHARMRLTVRHEAVRQVREVPVVARDEAAALGRGEREWRLVALAHAPQLIDAYNVESVLLATQPGDYRQEMLVQ